jgi:hypothetical protein
VRPSAQRFKTINKRGINMKHSLRIDTGSSYKNLQEHLRRSLGCRLGYRPRYRLGYRLVYRLGYRLVYSLG